MNMNLPMSNIKQPLLAGLMLFTTTMLSAGAQPLFTFEQRFPVNFHSGLQNTGMLQITSKMISTHIPHH